MVVIITVNSLNENIMKKGHQISQHYNSSKKGVVLLDKLNSVVEQMYCRFKAEIKAYLEKMSELKQKREF